MTEYITKEQALYIVSYAANTGNLDKARKLLDVAPEARKLLDVAPEVRYCPNCGARMEVEE